MKRSSKKPGQYRKLFRFFLFVQVSTLIIAVVINMVILMPNNYKQQHTLYQACLDQNKKSETQVVCQKPYK